MKPPPPPPPAPPGLGVPEKGPKVAKVDVRVMDQPEFLAFVERVKDFIAEYAWHGRECVSIDADGNWRRGNRPCSCGYDEALSSLVKK